ncbi:MAG TPA: helix-turn-helix domain-containing protein [Acidimicrobiales bacterium]|nr:helix-turn-helix domain-containing protein [Acidimicrobiales bacterium]
MREEEGGKAMRADARRNYDRLVAAARQVFAREGGGASMDAIAKEARVGVGTLYRHFPRRIDLVEAVYQSDVDALIVTAEKAQANLEPWEALVSFLEAFVRYAQGKRTFINELQEAFEKHPELRVGTRERIDAAVAEILRRAQEAGVARTDIEGTDLFQLMGSMCTNPALTSQQSARLLPMIVDGLRPPR